MTYSGKNHILVSDTGSGSKNAEIGLNTHFQTLPLSNMECPQNLRFNGILHDLFWGH